MNTVFLLMAEFNTSQIELNKVCERFLAMKPPKANRLASVQKLPFPVYRGVTQKTPWMVHVDDLAIYIDTQRNKAASDWEKMNA